jgi:hypothetical protein
MEHFPEKAKKKVRQFHFNRHIEKKNLKERTVSEQSMHTPL